jgi:hypothetical protein
MRRLVLALVFVAPFLVGRADAITVRDVIELSKAGLSDDVLLALIESDRNVFTLDAATMKALKDGGVSDRVMLALIHSGRTPAAAPAEPTPQAAAAQPAPTEQEPRIIVIDHHDSTPPQPAVPTYVPTYGFGVPTAGFGVTGVGFGVGFPAGVAIGFPIAGSGVIDPLGFRSNRVTRNVIVPTSDGGAVRADLPLPSNCVNAQPVFWGNGGKLRQGSWAPPPQILCR